MAHLFFPAEVCTFGGHGADFVCVCVLSFGGGGELNMTLLFFGSLLWMPKSGASFACPFAWFSGKQNQATFFGSSFREPKHGDFSCEVPFSKWLKWSQTNVCLCVFLVPASLRTQRIKSRSASLEHSLFGQDRWSVRRILKNMSFSVCKLTKRHNTSRR